MTFSADAAGEVLTAALTRQFPRLFHAEPFFQPMIDAVVCSVDGETYADPELSAWADAFVAANSTVIEQSEADAGVLDATLVMPPLPCDRERALAIRQQFDVALVAALRVLGYTDMHPKVPVSDEGWVEMHLGGAGAPPLWYAEDLRYDDMHIVLEHSDGLNENMQYIPRGVTDEATVDDVVEAVRKLQAIAENTATWR